MKNDLIKTYLTGKEPRNQRHSSLEDKLQDLLNQEVNRTISPDDLELLGLYKNTFTWNETFELDVDCQIDLYAPNPITVEIRDRNKFMSYISGEETPEIDVDDVFYDYSVSDLDKDVTCVDGVSDPQVYVRSGSLKLKEEFDPLVIKFTNFVNGLNEEDKYIFFNSSNSTDLIKIYSKLQNEYFVSTKEDKTNV